ncbi:AAA family ATPase [Gulosibacter chungangensis]|uniref:AAA family ATPase n=1 Tax=Gulosibacter chungangensis TaxID=979746 RepID=A0A7J5BA33_9MICO|nr:AAA family ATPase [Gulosibacter chungangensis]KAB1640982.1 AAA family ATPase [Gulosibacter chungangensis]
MSNQLNVHFFEKASLRGVILAKNVQNILIRYNLWIMLILSFSIENHKSIRDQLVLDLVKPSLKTLQPREKSTWGEQVYAIAGIFGPNASGKSAILDAFGYFFTAIAESATSWQAHPVMYRAPFKLELSSLERSSTYELEFVHAERRFAYGFSVDDAGISREWLRDIPSSRWRTLLDRSRDQKRPYIHPSIPKLGNVTDRELVLSRAILLNHPVLGAVGKDLVESFDSMTVKDTHRERRLSSITESLATGSITFDDIVTLLQVADIGVVDVEIQEDRLPIEVQEVFKGFQEVIARQAESGDRAEGRGHRIQVDIGLEGSDAVIRNLTFKHQGESPDRPSLFIQEESDGTVAWLATIVPAVEILRNGGLFCVDEIDASLHPHLVEVLLSIFADPEINTNGAQLVFTSHDAYLLSPLSDVELAPEQVWFTEKSGAGVTLLSSLADFPRHRDANVAKRYLTGRYGGTPRLAPSGIDRVLRREDA